MHLLACERDLLGGSCSTWEQRYSHIPEEDHKANHWSVMSETHSIYSHRSSHIILSTLVHTSHLESLLKA